jgi:non-haem Fe2+, alpha-ketoglutarate-dependent halogenase
MSQVVKALEQGPLPSLDEVVLGTNARPLTSAEIAQFRTAGYVKNLPVFSAAGAQQLRAGFEQLAMRLPAGIDISRVNMWHKCSRWFHDLCRTPAILDYVENLLGPDFFQWGGQFFVKYPGDGTVVPWHQDAQYWPLTPRRTVTVWLALTRVDAANGAMRVVSGSHIQGEFDHHTNPATNLVLDQEVAGDQIDKDKVVILDLEPGQISLHDDGLLHGSLANHSDRLRCGLTMRFCPTQVACDLSVWPTFEAYLARGRDLHQLNPNGPIPTGESFPVRKFMHSSEFDFT